MINKNIEQYTEYIKCINDIINENKRDIGNDTTSDYAKMRIKQNKILNEISRLFYDKLDAHKYQE